MPSNVARIATLVTAVQSAFFDRPALTLTLDSAQRRFGTDAVTCAGVLGALVDAHVLEERDGMYRRHFPAVAVRSAA